MKIFLIIYALRFRHRKCNITMMSILGKPFTLYQFVPCSYVFCVVVFKLSKRQEILSFTQDTDINYMYVSFYDNTVMDTFQIFLLMYVGLFLLIGSKVHLFAQTTLNMVHEVHYIKKHLEKNKVRGMGTQYTCDKKKENIYTCFIVLRRTFSK